jgi:hypothetical protein
MCGLLFAVFLGVTGSKLQLLSGKNDRFGHFAGLTKILDLKQ